MEFKKTISGRELVQRSKQYYYYYNIPYWRGTTTILTYNMCEYLSFIASKLPYISGCNGLWRTVKSSRSDQ